MHVLNCFFGQPAEAKGDLDFRENGPLSSLHLFLLILKDGGLDCPLREMMAEVSEGLEVCPGFWPNGRLFKVRKNRRKRERDYGEN